MTVAVAGIFASSVQAAGVLSRCSEANLIASLAGGGKVTFACNGTIVLTQPVTISSNTTIDGSGKTITISGGNAAQIFLISFDASLTLNQVILEGGASQVGGAVENVGTLTISNSIVRNNTAVFDGGAIFNVGTLNVTNTLFEGNSASISNGGAIANDGVATVANCVFTNNSANSGAAIDNSTNTLQVVNSLFVDNIATGLGGAILNDATAVVLNSAIIANKALIGGGVDGDAGSITVNNSIFAVNSPSNCAGTVSGTADLSTDNSCPGTKIF